MGYGFTEVPELSYGLAVRVAVLVIPYGVEEVVASDPGAILSVNLILEFSPSLESLDGECTGRCALVSRGRTDESLDRYVESAVITLCVYHDRVCRAVNCKIVGRLRSDDISYVLAENTVVCEEILETVDILPALYHCLAVVRIEVIALAVDRLPSGYESVAVAVYAACERIAPAVREYRSNTYVLTILGELFALEVSIVRIWPTKCYMQMLPLLACFNY